MWPPPCLQLLGVSAGLQYCAGAAACRPLLGRVCGVAGVAVFCLQLLLLRDSAEACGA